MGIEPQGYKTAQCPLEDLTASLQSECGRGLQEWQSLAVERMAVEACLASRSMTSCWGSASMFLVSFIL